MRAWPQRRPRPSERVLSGLLYLCGFRPDFGAFFQSFSAHAKLPVEVIHKFDLPNY